MKILIYHNRYQLAGGEDISVETDVKMLVDRLHEVIVREVDNHQINAFNLGQKIGLLVNTAWNRKVYYEVRSTLQTLKPDLVHVHNFFPLYSPAIHTACHDLNIPSIQHLHNFRLGCLNAYLLKNQQVCNVCVGKNPWRGLIYRCYRNSLPDSILVWIMITVNRWRKTWENEVTQFIVPSQFSRDKLIEIGLPQHKISVKSPLISYLPPHSQPLPIIPTFLFIGRLYEQKGVSFLLKVWEGLNQPQWRLNLIGEGNLQTFIEDFVREKNWQNVNLLGKLSLEQINQEIRHATVVLLPSLSYETFGRTILEAYSNQRGVIVSHLGALPEIVIPEKTGFLLPPGNKQAWINTLHWVGNHPQAMLDMGLAGRQLYETHFNPDLNYQQLMSIYHHTILV